MDFQRTSTKLAADYVEAGWAREDADLLARGQTLIAKVENANTVDEMRDVLRDMIRDLYLLGHPVNSDPAPTTKEVRSARISR